MSAIFGILRFDRRLVSSSDMSALSKSLKPIAPEDENVLFEESVGFGCLLLRTTPESLNEVLPVRHPETGVLLTADARIDNRSDLYKPLKITNREISDSEIILQAYLEWGEDCVARLRGDFVFVIWDPRTGHLYCVRDHLGGRSFYYLLDKECLVFATKPEAIVSLPQTEKVINDDYIASLLVPQLSLRVNDNTPFDKVKGLMPGTTLKVSREGKSSIQKYWELQQTDSYQHLSFEECHHEFERLFDQALTDKLRSAKPVSLMVSGGTDSAMLATRLGRLSDKRGYSSWSTYSAVSDSKAPCPETEAIRAITQGPHFSPYYLSVPSFRELENIDVLLRLTWDHPHPVDNTLLLASLLAQQASRDSHNVILHGVSGDIVQWQDSDHIKNVAKSDGYLSAWREAKYAARNNSYIGGVTHYTLFLISLYNIHTPLAFRSLVHRSRIDQNLLPAYLAGDFVKEMGLRERAIQIRQARFLQYARLTPFERYKEAIIRIVIGLTGYNRVVGKYGMESRDPWADIRLVEFFANIPERYKTKEGWIKPLARTSIEKDLDAKHCWRMDKVHLGYYCHRRAMAECDADIARIIHSDFGAAERYVSKPEVSRLYRKHKSGDIVASTTLYSLLIFIIWLKKVYNPV